MKSFGGFDLQAWVGEQLSGELIALARRLKERAAFATTSISDAIPWSVYVARRLEMKQLGLSQFLDLLEAKHILPNELSDAYAYAVFASIVRDAFRRYPQLGKFSGLKHSKVRRI
jgi:hypothetical protein